MSLRQKLMAVLAIPAVVLLLATALAYQASQRRTESTALVTRTYRILTVTESAMAELSSAESGLRGYLITGDPGMVHPYRRSRQHLETSLRDLRQLVLDPQAERLVIGLADHVHRRTDVLDRLANRASTHLRISPSRMRAITKQGEIAMQNVLGYAEKLREREHALLDVRKQQLENAEDLAFIIRMFGLPGGLLAAGVIVALFAGRLLKRIEALSENTRRLEQGLPLVDSSTHRDELGELERTFVQTGTKVIELQGELQRLATIDPLTNLANRRGFLETAEHRLDLARRQGTTLALLFIDADGLKKVNDTAGHAAGDELLQEIGALLRDTFRQSDLPARLGGDEFCVLVSADTIAGIDVARTRLTEAIAMANRLPGRTYELSVSLGVAVFDRDHDRSIDDLIGRADMLMYQEKHMKRELRGAVDASTDDPVDDPGDEVAPPSSAEVPSPR